MSFAEDGERERGRLAASHHQRAGDLAREPGVDRAQVITALEAAVNTYPPATHAAQRARALHELGTELMRPETAGRAVTVLEDAVRTFAELGDSNSRASSLANLGTAYLQRADGNADTDRAKAIDCYRAALAAHTLAQHPEEFAVGHANLGTAYLLQARSDTSPLRSLDLASAVQSG